MSCSNRPRRSAARAGGPSDPKVVFREANVPPLEGAELRLRLRLLASALVDVWIEGGGLAELREEARNDRPREKGSWPSNQTSPKVTSSREGCPTTPPGLTPKTC